MSTIQHACVILTIFVRNNINHFSPLGRPEPTLFKNMSTGQQSFNNSEVKSWFWSWGCNKASFLTRNIRSSMVTEVNSGVIRVENK